MKTWAVAAVLTSVWLVSLSAMAQTGKGLSQSDVSKINQATQASVKAALAKGLDDLGSYTLTMVPAGAPGGS